MIGTGMLIRVFDFVIYRKGTPMPAPANLEGMLEVLKIGKTVQLCSGIYNLNGKIYFGNDLHFTWGSKLSILRIP